MVFGLKLVRFALIATALVPEPIDCVVVEVNVVNVLLVPHSNHTDVALPFGFTLPLSVDELDVTEVAAVVVTVGKVGAGAVVVKLHAVDHALVPPLFFALTRQ